MMSEQENRELKDRAEAALEKLVDLFNKQDLPCMIKKTYLAGYDKPSNHWSLGNQLIMISEGTSDARSFNAWRQVGRYVKKGTHGFDIIKPIMKTFPVKNEDGTPKMSPEGKQIFINSLIGFTYQREFKFEDTDGKDLPLPETPKAPVLSEIAEKWGLKVKFDETMRGEYGSFNTETGEIRLCTSDEGTFLHELAHAAGQRIAKRKDQVLPTGQNIEEETIAQLTAATIGSLYGLKVEAYTFHYIAFYIENKSKEAVGRQCYKVLSKVQERINEILGALEDAPKVAAEAA